MDDHYHGTHVSGTIGGVGDNGVGVVGVNWNVTIIGCKFLNSGGSGSTADALECFEYFNALKDSDIDISITNNSWGGSFPVTFFTRAGVEAANPEAVAALQRALDAGTVIVFAAGNVDPVGLIDPTLEAGLPFLFPEFQDLWVAVMAVDLNGNKPLYTNRCGVAAAWCIAAPGGGDDPGSGVFSTVPGGGYDRLSGTSFAHPRLLETI